MCLVGPFLGVLFVFFGFCPFGPGGVFRIFVLCPCPVCGLVNIFEFLFRKKGWVEL